MIKPFLQDTAFLEDVAVARSDPENFHLWWLGQSGFLLQWQGHHLLMDPYLSESLTRKYAGSQRPHVRLTEPVIAPELLDFIDVVTSSHNHTDHFDPETIKPLRARNPRLQLIIPEANRPVATERLGMETDTPRGLDAGSAVALSGFKIHGVPAAHPTLEKDEYGRHRFLGYVFEFENWAIYHSGDTLVYPGLVERLRRWKIDVALLPINGDKPERGVAGNMDGAEAALLARQMEARVAIPCHYEMFSFNTVSPELFESTARELSQPVRLLRAGERFSSNSLKTGGA